jgi:glucose/arabinose dehydrogenase
MRHDLRRALPRRTVLLLALALTALGVAALAPAAPRVQTFVTGLDVPWALAWAPDGRLFVTERPGRLRVVVDGRLQPEPVATLPAYADGESGLMGLALDPAFADNGHLYVCYSTLPGASLINRARGPGQRINRLSRLTLSQGRAGAERVLLDEMPGAWNHDGCRVKFGPDGKLYVTMGDAADPPLAQRLDSAAGKIHRLEADGTVPADNPFRRPDGPSSVWTLGHRNPQGLAWDAAGRLYASEHGPSGHDEINLIQPGRNYGWPEVAGRVGARGEKFVEPILESGARDTWAPSGMAFLQGHLYVAGLRGQRLLRVTLGADGGVTGVTPLLAGTHGRLRDVVVGLDGALYVATNNRDGRGSPRPDDDRILRVIP